MADEPGEQARALLLKLGLLGPHVADYFPRAVEDLVTVQAALDAALAEGAKESDLRWGIFFGPNREVLDLGTIIAKARAESIKEGAVAGNEAGYAQGRDEERQRCAKIVQAHISEHENDDSDDPYCCGKTVLREIEAGE